MTKINYKFKVLLEHLTKKIIIIAYKYAEMND